MEIIVSHRGPELKAPSHLYENYERLIIWNHKGGDANFHLYRHDQEPGDGTPHPMYDLKNVSRVEVRE